MHEVSFSRVDEDPLEINFVGENYGDVDTKSSPYGGYSRWRRGLYSYDWMTQRPPDQILYNQRIFHQEECEVPFIICINYYFASIDEPKRQRHD